MTKHARSAYWTQIAMFLLTAMCRHVPEFTSCTVALDDLHRGMRIAILGLVLLAACTHDEHYLDVAWAVDHYDAYSPRGEGIACPEGWTTTRLVAVDAAHPTDRHVDTFPCADGTGRSSYLPSDTYQAWVELTNADGSKVFAASAPETVSVTSFEPLLLADLFVDAGFAEVDYAFGDATGCPQADVPPLDVRLDLVQPDHDPFVTSYEACTAGTIQSPAVPPGKYTATFTYHDITRTFDDVMIDAPNHITRLAVEL